MLCNCGLLLRRMRGRRFAKVRQLQRVASVLTCPCSKGPQQSPWSKGSVHGRSIKSGEPPIKTSVFVPVKPVASVCMLQIARRTQDVTGLGHHKYNPRRGQSEPAPPCQESALITRFLVIQTYNMMAMCYGHATPGRPRRGLSSKSALTLTSPLQRPHARTHAHWRGEQVSRGPRHSAGPRALASRGCCLPLHLFPYQREHAPAPPRPHPHPRLRASPPRCCSALGLQDAAHSRPRRPRPCPPLGYFGSPCQALALRLPWRHRRLLAATEKSGRAALVRGGGLCGRGRDFGVCPGGGVGRRIAAPPMTLCTSGCACGYEV